MPITERSHNVSIEIDGLVDLAGIEEAALDFARRAPAEMVASAVESLGADLVDVIVGRRGQPVRLRDQPSAPWSCNAPAVQITFDNNGIPPLRCDEGKLRQILTNLVENARKYAPESPVKVTAETHADQIQIDVIDHGTGITAENRERVFERFVQLDQSSTRIKGGTGLGLYLCRQLAHALGGTLELTEPDDGGCRFTLSVPWNLLDLPSEDTLHHEARTLVGASNNGE